MSSAITIQGLRKSYAQQQVLHEIELTVEAGSYIGLVGVNGAGKTTLIKSLLDFCSVNEGSIKIFDVDHRQPESRQRLAFLPEKFIPPYYLSARDFLVFMHELHGQKFEEEEACAMLELLDFDPAFINKSVGQLSKGMSQKVGLAACLLSKKELLVLDEPMSGLDPRARAHLKQHLLKIKEEGRTLFFSTHMLADVEALCDTVAILHRGGLRFVGSPRQCCEEFNTQDFEQAYLNCVAEK